MAFLDFLQYFKINGQWGKDYWLGTEGLNDWLMFKASGNDLQKLSDVIMYKYKAPLTAVRYLNACLPTEAGITKRNEP